MTDFITREIPSDAQLDSSNHSKKKRQAADSAMIEPGVAKKKKKSTPSENLAESLHPTSKLSRMCKKCKERTSRIL
jgi:hypothetical protein